MIQAIPFKPVFCVFFKQEQTRRQTLIDACALESGRFRIPLLQGFIYHRVENLAANQPKNQNQSLKFQRFSVEEHALITREQMATILYRYSRFKGKDVSQTVDLGNFTDAGSVSDWAKDAMAWAVEVKLIARIKLLRFVVF